MASAQTLHGSESRRPARVAIIGTGLAGLTTAYLLQNDTERRYAVTLFEQANGLSFDSASVAVKNNTTGEVERVDLPMRASAGGYYANLMRMYSYLNIRLHPVRFLFVFAKALPSSSASSSSSASPHQGSEAHAVGSAPGSYFVHASNLHQTPPPWPSNRSVLAHFIEVLYLIVCHFWFSIACFLVRPRADDTFADYAHRIWLPRRYTSHYLLPLMSSVSTCTHDEMLAFPASDVVGYKNLSHGQHHYTVCGGVNQVQDQLAAGLSDIRLAARVLAVQADATGPGTTVRWITNGQNYQEVFDRVVLAVSPDIASRIYQPLQEALYNFPTVQAESSILSLDRTASIEKGDEGEDATAQCAHHSGATSPAQAITLRTMFSPCGSRTEAMHTMPSGVVVSTCPLDADADAKKALHTARFTRTLRTVESRQVIERIMRHPRHGHDAKGESDDEASLWVNGQDNVWLTGAWCWDGMVLLEGCVVSAMRVADDFGVRIPWQKNLA